MRRILLFISIFLAGCANSDFPFCCGQAGDKNVPYSTTYLFSFGTGFTPIVGANTFLGIVSQGDLNNLFNAANISRIPGTGTINGSVVSFSGGTISNVVLEVTDLNGNKIGDLFYNSLGGIPDFSSTAGTSDNGGFTVLNTPPGEVYIRAVKGGRGNTVATSFLDSVSTISLPVRPIVPPFFGITGDVSGYPGNEKISGAILSPVGLKGLSVVSSGGRYRFPRLGSDSQFLIQGTASGYLPTYQEIATDLNSCIVPPPTFCTGANCAPPSINLGPCNSGGVDLTQNLYFLSRSVLTDYLGNTRFLKQTGYSGLDPSAGILVGSMIDQDDTIRQYPYLLLTNDSGDLLNFDPVTRVSRIYYPGTSHDVSTGINTPTFFFFDSDGTHVSWFDAQFNIQTLPCDPADTCPSIYRGKTDGTFVVFNLPPGVVHLSATAKEKLEDGLDYFTGRETVEIFPGGATKKNIKMNKITLGQNYFYQSVSGKVVASDSNIPVSFARTYALGQSNSYGVADISGNFNFPLNSNVFLDQTHYTLKVSRDFFIDTYQNIKVDSSFKNLVLFPVTLMSQYLSAAGLPSAFDSTRGILTGIIYDNVSHRGTEGITLEATDLSGNVVGDVRYFDSLGLPTLSRFSSKNGRYMIFNLPPGLTQIRVVSPDDSGNILMDMYANGVVLSDLQVNNSPPPFIQVSGITEELDKTPVGGVTLTVRGEKTRFKSATDGTFSQPFETFSRFVVKAKSSQPDGIDTYSSIETIDANRSDLRLKTVHAATLQAQASKGIPPLLWDSTNGTLGGKVITSGFKPPVQLSGYPVSGFNSAPLLNLSQQRVSTGLFDDDNEVDLAVINSTDQTLTLLLGNGDGTFTSTPGSPYCMPTGIRLLPGQSCNTRATPVSVKSADFNQDGILDFAVANFDDDSITILFGTKRGDVVPGGVIHLLPGSRPVAISVADFNKDQQTDLVVLNSGNRLLTWIQGAGTGGFNPPIYLSLGGISPGTMLSRDFNGDGNPDLAIIDTGANLVSIFLGLGNGGFTPAPNSPIFIGKSPIAIASNDINNDGKDDLIIANQGSNSLNILLNKGGGIFTPAKNSPITLSGSPQFIALNDIDFDGRLDLVVSIIPSGIPSGTISLLSGLGDGTFTSETPYSAGPGENAANFVLADYNDDLYTDLVVFQTSGKLAFLAGIEVPLPGVRLAASDLNGNGVGGVRYLNSAGNVDPSLSVTGPSGEFLVFNVPPGFTNVHATGGASGNRFMTSYAGSATFGNISAVPPDFRKIQFSGKTINPVGNQIGRFVEGVSISFLGTGIGTFSDPVNAGFNVDIDAKSSFLIKLQK